MECAICIRSIHIHLQHFLLVDIQEALHMDTVSCLCKWKSDIYVCSNPYTSFVYGRFFLNFDTDGTPQDTKKHHENGLNLQHTALKAKIQRSCAPHWSCTGVQIQEPRRNASSNRYLRKPFPGKQLAKAFPVVTQSAQQPRSELQHTSRQNVRLSLAICLTFQAPEPF